MNGTILRLFPCDERARGEGGGDEEELYKLWGLQTSVVKVSAGKTLTGSALSWFQSQQEVFPKLLCMT